MKQRCDCTRLNVGVPTWFYGHEPPNVFGTVIAKYFDNAIREDILLRLCGAGIVYSPGRAGTTQEIFQALTRNYYALEGHQIRPMILLGVDYWTTQVPAWPLLQGAWPTDGSMEWTRIERVAILVDSRRRGPTPAARAPRTEPRRSRTATRGRRRRSPQGVSPPRTHARVG